MSGSVHVVLDCQGCQPAAASHIRLASKLSGIKRADGLYTKKEVKKNQVSVQVSGSV